jgi:hypothetical protein
MFLPETAYIPDFCKIPVMHVFLNVETDSRTKLLKVSSRQCGRSYDGSSTVQNIQQIRDGIDGLYQSSPSFQQDFFQSFDEGTLIEKPSLSIYLARSYSNLNHGQKDNKSLYKFIFIITN